MGKGRRGFARLSAATTADSPRWSKGKHSVHPVAISVRGKRVEVRAICLGATMGHQVSFKKAWFGFIPILEGANGNLLFQQRSRPSGRDPMPLLLAVRSENPICGRRTHREELHAALLAQVEMSMPQKPTQPVLAGKGSAAWRRCGWLPSTLGAAPVVPLARSGVAVDARWSAWVPQDAPRVGWHTCVHSLSLRQTHRE